MMAQRLQEEIPPCIELEHKKADLAKAEGNGWGLGEIELIDGVYVMPISKSLATWPGLPHHYNIGVVSPPLPLQLQWQRGEIIYAYSEEELGFPPIPCSDWPRAIMEQVKSEVLAPSLPLWAVAGIVGGCIVGGALLLR